MKNGLSLCLIAFVSIVGTGYAQPDDSLEKRVRILEQKIANLEEIINHRTIPDTKAAQKANPPPATAQRATAPITQPAQEPVRDIDLSRLVRARLFKKNLQTTTDGKTVSLLIAFTNTSRDNIRGFKGTITLNDGSGMELMSFAIALNKPIASYDSESWFGEVPFDAYKPGYARLEILDAETIQTTIVIDEVVFADGKTVHRE